MKYILRMFVMVVLIGTSLAAVPPGVNAQTVQQGIATECQPGSPGSQKIGAALKILETNSIGGPLVTVIRDSGIPVCFADLSGTGVLARFSSNSTTGAPIAIQVNSEFMNSPDQVIAALIAHEAQHLQDRNQFDDTVDTATGCFVTELSAFATGEQVWSDLRGSVINQAGALQDPGVLQMEADYILVTSTIGSLNQHNLDPRHLSADLIRYIEFHYSDATNGCVARFSNDLQVGQQIESRLIEQVRAEALSGSQIASSTPVTPPPSTSSSSSSTAGSTVAGQTVGSNVVGTNRGGTTNVGSSTTSSSSSTSTSGATNTTATPTQLPSAGGFPLTELTLLASGLAGAGYGLRRIVRK